MRPTCRRTTMTALILGSILAVAAPAALAAGEPTERPMKWQFTLPLTFTSGASWDGQEGTSVDVNDDLGWGFGFGYHMNERVMFGADFTWLSANYDAFMATDFDGDEIADDSVEISGALDASSLQMVGQFNILPTTITPFVKGNFGWTWIDSNIPAGPAEGVCWWHPWYGYICDTWQPTYEDTAFSYGGAVGIRAELRPTFFLEGSYNILWIDFDDADTADLDGWRFTLGWIF